MSSIPLWSTKPTQLNTQADRRLPGYSSTLTEQAVQFLLLHGYIVHMFPSSSSFTWTCAFVHAYMAEMQLYRSCSSEQESNEQLFGQRGCQTFCSKGKPLPLVDMRQQWVMPAHLNTVMSPEQGIKGYILIHQLQKGKS